MALSAIALMVSFSVTACGVADEQGDENDPISSESTDNDSAALEGDDDNLIGRQKCGNNECGPGTFCCNASCGVCAPKGGACTQQVCDPVAKVGEDLTVGEVCGSVICGKGLSCCNASCSRCVPKGMMCTQEACN
ncbi:hypothetical protein [Chondromyces crocatus]|nr:hypothetical protein [Chondromyces crocatus]